MLYSHTNPPQKKAAVLSLGWTVYSVRAAYAPTVRAASGTIIVRSMVYVGRAHLEASAERWSRLLGLLEELWRWICLKDEELAKQMPLGGDVPTLLQQQNYCTVRIAATGIVYQVSSLR